MHSEPLLHRVKTSVITLNEKTGERNTSFNEMQKVYEYRWPPFLQAAGMLIFISPPVQHVLGLTPTSVLAEHFLIVGEQSLAVNHILYCFFYVLAPTSSLSLLLKGIKTIGASMDTRCCRL
jgi:hypothetical protein